MMIQRKEKKVENAGYDGDQLYLVIDVFDGQESGVSDKVS
jgi:hypothetical protein